ncbi:hypothetical protein [Parashewanella tropica]|uniref:hypothetical protein n=1 Tax=Parashewanella tropica TaxID=2547970 RepID=UPI001059EE96|nr:hypothetical protein [Parashewanella tropica]
MAAPAGSTQRLDTSIAPEVSATTTVSIYSRGQESVFEQFIGILNSQPQERCYPDTRSDDATLAIRHVIQGSNHRSIFEALSFMAALSATIDTPTTPDTPAATETKPQWVINKPKNQTNADPSSQTVVFGYQFSDGTYADLNRLDNVPESELTAFQTKHNFKTLEYSDDDEVIFRDGFDGSLRGAENPIQHQEYALLPLPALAGDTLKVNDTKGEDVGKQSEAAAQQLKKELDSAEQSFETVRQSTDNQLADSKKASSEHQRKAEEQKQ